MLSWITNFLCPPTKGASYQQAESCFTKEELEAIQKEHCVHVLSQYIQTVDDQHFLEWAGLQHAAAALKQGLCNAVRRLSGEAATAITLDGIIIAKARCEKMDRATAEDFAYDIMDVEQQGSVTLDHLAAVVAGCITLATAAASSGSSSASADHSAAAAAIAQGMVLFSGEGASSLIRDGYARLCKTSPALNASLLSLLCNIGKCSCPSQPLPDPTQAPHPAGTPTAITPAASTGQLLSPAGAAADAAAAAAAAPSTAAHGSQGSYQHLASKSSSRAGLSSSTGKLAGPAAGSAAALAAAAAAAAVPQCPGRLQLPLLGWGLCSPAESLLQPAWVWLLAPGLPPPLRQDWRLLFNSTKHGMSYSTFLGRLGQASPTLLLLRDKGGAVCGAIAHAPWQKTGTFYGDYASSIFGLLPQARIYPASGINANLQWCGVGFSQLPNGVGFGGQVGHFGLFVDATLDTGMSRPCATYASPCLASSQVFQVDVVEAWLLQPPEEEQQDGAGTASGGSSRGAGLSALDKAKADRQILQWAGVDKNYSAMVKDEPIED
ncbi:hypothetical protein OEZ86_005327 [Tetradesmus obliquus]|nr:hypothetical protein OEZ86_005327 [Tetradesmus obliquus]